MKWLKPNSTCAGHRFESTRGMKRGIMLHLTQPTAILPLFAPRVLRCHLPLRNTYNMYMMRSYLN